MSYSTSTLVLFSYRTDNYRSGLASRLVFTIREMQYDVSESVDEFNLEIMN